MRTAENLITNEDLYLQKKWSSSYTKKSSSYLPTILSQLDERHQGSGLRPLGPCTGSYNKQLKALYLRRSRLKIVEQQISEVLIIEIPQNFIV